MSDPRRRAPECWVMDLYARNEFRRTQPGSPRRRVHYA